MLGREVNSSLLTLRSLSVHQTHIPLKAPSQIGLRPLPIVLGREVNSSLLTLRSLSVHQTHINSIQGFHISLRLLTGRKVHEWLTSVPAAHDAFGRRVNPRAAMRRDRLLTSAYDSTLGRKVTSGFLTSAHVRPDG